MKKITTYLFVVFIHVAFTSAAQQNDGELNRDSVVGWQYITNPINPKAVYKPTKGELGGTALYSPWQQQASDMLFNWIQQSYLPRGLAMRTISKNDQRWYLSSNGPLHSYGVHLLGYAARFRNGKIDLKCCELGERLKVDFNYFPGRYIKGFNPNGLHFFAELAQFCSVDDDAQLSKEGIDKKIQPSLYKYRTYLNHYHNKGEQVFKMSIVVPENNNWPFKPVLVKDAVAYIQQQMAAYPAIMQKNPYSVDPVNKALERLKPYYNEVAKTRRDYDDNLSLKDDKGHYLLNPEGIINGQRISKEEYSFLVSTTQQTIDQSKTDNPLWVYFDLTPNSDALWKNPGNYDTKFGTGNEHMINALLNNFNFDFVYQWLSQPNERKNLAYKPIKTPAKSSGNIFETPTLVSAKTSSKNKDPYTILYEDFEGFSTGTFSAKGWHTFGFNGNQFKNATLSTLNEATGKWISIPKDFTFYPDFTKQPGSNFTIIYDVFFDKKIQYKRTPIWFRLETDNYINIKDLNRNGFDFSLASSGEAETNIRFMKKNIDEKVKRFRVENFKAGEIVHISISVNGSSVAVSVNNKEVFKEATVLPSGLKYTKIGWYSGEPGNYLSNIYVKNSSSVQTTSVQEPVFAGVVKDPKTPTADAGTFESKDYTFKPLVKLDKMPAIKYPTGFKSIFPEKPQSSNKAVASLPPFKAPERSALLNTVSSQVLTANTFKKFIDDLKNTVAAKLNSENTGKIDNYLKTKKINTSITISNTAIGAWTEGSPTLSLYLLCKALQADYTDMNAANNLASLLNAYGYSEKAIPVLQYINNKITNNPVVQANMAVAYYNLGDMNNAAAFAAKSIEKDSLNANANKVAAYNHLAKASQTGNKAEAEKAIGCLKQVLKSQYDAEVSAMLNKIESNHRSEQDYFNTNFNEFPMLKRLEILAMPEDLKQMKSFNIVLAKEKAALSETNNKITIARNKIPEQSSLQRVDKISKNQGAIQVMMKAAVIISNATIDYTKLKYDLEEIFKADLKNLTTEHNKKTNAILKRYTEQLNKLEGGEGRVDEEKEIERLLKERCNEYNKEQTSFLSLAAALTNTFAQQSEYVSRNYWRDYANWGPLAQGDTTMVPFLVAQNGYLTDVQKILSNYPIIEPCIYPTEPIKEDKTPAKPKPFEEAYCANFKGSYGLGAAKINFSCNSMTISGGEGFIGEMGLNFNDNGTFKEVTIGAGIGAEFMIGNQNITSVSAGVSALEYITICPSANGTVQVNDWGINAGVSAGGNIGKIGGEVNIISGGASINSGVQAGGVISNALGLNK